MALLSATWIKVSSITLFAALVGDTFAKPVSSLSDLDLEAAEAKMTLETLIEENQQIKEKLAVVEATASQLAESLAIANSEAEIFRRQTAELKLRGEALGLSGTGDGATKLEQRLLKAVNDLRIVEADRKKLAVVLSGLSEAIVRYVKVAVSTDASARVDLEVQMRRVNDAIGSTADEATPTAASAVLTDGLVISTKEELNIVVANLGAKQGVKVGMPFQVLRGERRIGVIRIIDVREKIAGAVVQNLSSEKDKIRIGDQLKVEASQ